MDFDGEVVKFNVYEAMRYLNDVNSICGIHVINPLVEEIFDLTFDGLSNFVGTTPVECAALDALTDSMSRNDWSSPMALPLSNTKLLTSVMQVPKLELKQLSGHLKYAYLDEHEIMWVIISSKLTLMEEEKNDRSSEEGNSKDPGCRYDLPNL